VIALLPALALGHAGGPLAGLDVSERATGSLVETSLGLLVDSDALRWTCHETVTRADAVLTPRYVTAGEALLAVVPDPTQARQSTETLYRSTDQGCSWGTTSGLTGMVVARVAAHGTTAVSVTADPSPGATNGAYISRDAGETWTLALSAPDRLFVDVRGAAESWWTASFRLDGVEPQIHRSTDGTLWETLPIDTSAVARSGSTDADPLVVRVLAVASSSEAWVVADPRLGDTLLHTTDGGQTWTAVLSVGGELVDAALDAEGTLWVVEGNRFLYRSTDGQTFTRDDSAPFAAGIGLRDGALALAHFPEQAEGALVSEGPPWSTTWFPSAVTGELVCPPDSDHAQVCSALWPTVAETVARFTPIADTGGSGDSASKPGRPRASGCGCMSGRPGAGWLWVLTLVAARRDPRRRGSRQG
jgi:photosystem II stability/assembly factor-like uncharacterized protein